MKFVSVCGVLSHCVADELNILLVGSGDCRHIMKTFAHCHQHPATQINVGFTLLLF